MKEGRGRGRERSNIYIEQQRKRRERNKIIGSEKEERVKYTFIHDNQLRIINYMCESSNKVTLSPSIFHDEIGILDGAYQKETNVNSRACSSKVVIKIACMR